MESFAFWLLATCGFWVLSNQASNLIEATVHQYWRRIAFMVAAGLGIGALASAVGYTYGILPVLLLVQLWNVRKKLLIVGVPSGLAGKHLVPGLLMIACSAAGSFLFAIELCDQSGADCRRVFFERLYTPPHLRAQGAQQ